MNNIPVLIAGGGPVGMTLALSLSRHGVASILVERNPSTTSHPKMDLTNGRSMELFRALGIGERLRAVGVPPDQPLDVVWATRLSGHVLHRFEYPTPNQKRTDTIAANDGSGTSEPSMRVSQVIIEPVLKAAIDENPLIDVRFGWSFEELQQDAEGVTALIRNMESGEAESVRSQYLAGCDGGGSTVRRRIGVSMEGNHNVARIYMVHFRSSDHKLLSRFGTVYHFQTAHGSMVPQDGREIWTMHCPILPGTDEAKLDPAEALRNWVGEDFEFEILIANPWSAHMVVADRYLVDRVVLAGDAAHQVIPAGGYGMNMGIGDAVDLGWKLAASVIGWGGPELLRSYEYERRPIAIQNRAAAARHVKTRMSIRTAVLEAEATGSLDRPEAAALRAQLSAHIAALGNAENESWGIEHGYSYDSPIICAEPSEAPPFDPLLCYPTTRPGARLPAVFLEDGRPIADLLGPGFTLISIGSVFPGGFATAAANQGLPLSIVVLDDAPELALLECKLILVRPDQHVAWRGNIAPDDCDAVLRHATGWSGKAQ